MDKLIRILHLEDDPNDAEIILKKLESGGNMTYEVTRVLLRSEFEAALQNGKFDIILADFNLPTFDGLSALKIKQELKPDIPFIFVSGTIGEDAAIEGLTRGATDYVLKQRLARLVPAVQRAMDEAEVRRAHKKAEEALRNSEELYRKLVATIPDLILRTDLDGNILFMNDFKFSSVTTTSKEQFIGKNIFSFISKNDLDRAKTNTKLMFEKSLGPREYTLDFDDGEHLVCEVNGEVLLDADNEPYGFVYVVRDVSARKRAEDEVRMLSRAVEQSPASIIITDTSGNIEYVNSKFSEVTGYSSEEVLGKNPRLLKSGKVNPKVYEQLWRTITSGEEWYGEFYNQKKNGELYWELVSISPVFDSKGAIIHFLAVKEDITERKQTEKELIAAKEKAEGSDRLKSAFLANMSHEIRTPLNSILGFSELLVASETGPSEKQKFSEMIRNSGDNLLCIITDIMDISKIEAGQVQTKRSTINVNQLLDTINDEFSLKAASKGIEFRINQPAWEGELFIYSDPGRLRQVLLNLLNNALKFTKSGFIELGFQNTEGLFQFYVKDTGIGISKEFHQQIFEPFRQIEPALSRKYGGLGLGLPISKSLVELLGGRIWMESEDGKGSTFYFTIPGNM